jgi:hypothetical protein
VRSRVPAQWMAARANPTISLFYARCKKAKIFFGATFSEDLSRAMVGTIDNLI